MNGIEHPIRVVHVITGLDRGGAENVLMQVATGMQHDCFHNHVISLTGIGPIGERIADAGVPIVAVEFERPLSSHMRFIHLCREIRRARPHIVQTWMYHGDLIGGLASRLVSRAPVVWNLRQSNLEPENSKASTVVIRDVCARLSSLVPAEIVCGSFAARAVHTARGYDEERTVVLPNGFDTDLFQPASEEQRQAARRRFGLDDGAFVIGLAARHHAQKDHATFCRAAALVARHRPDVRFLLAGHDITSANTELARLLESTGVGSTFHLAGPLDDIRPFYNAIDGLAMSSAFGEGAPNVVGEAMASGLPCVVTDVGDCASMVGDFGFVAPPREPTALARSIEQLAEMLPDRRRAMGALARQRIERMYSRWVMIDRYEMLYRRIYAQRYPAHETTAVRTSMAAN